MLDSGEAQIHFLHFLAGEACVPGSAAYGKGGFLLEGGQQMNVYTLILFLLSGTLTRIIPDQS